MGQLEQLTKPPIEPIYWQTAPSEIIDFGSVQLAVPNDAGEELPPVAAQVRQRFTPRPSLEFFIPAPTNGSPLARIRDDFARFGAGTIKIRLAEHGTSFDAFCASSSSEGLIYIPVQSPVQIHPQSTSISRAVFHLMNWPNFFGPEDFVLQSGQEPAAGSCRCGRFSLIIGDWCVTVWATGSTTAAVDSLEKHGGFIVTHIGDARRLDDRPFRTQELDRLLGLLSYFFSFTLGRWSGPSLAVGFDAGGNRVYEQWGLPRCAGGAWPLGRSCFHTMHSELFGGLMPGFSRLWTNDAWQTTLTRAIYWYVSANQIGSGVNVDSALLFTQSALELLAWTHCVLDTKTVSAGTFNGRGMNTAEKLRLLVRSLEIPLALPENARPLHAKRGKKWTDSMDAITDLRNGLVHAGAEKQVPNGAYYEAWKLSQWYIEVTLLRLCSYSGRYMNRLNPSLFKGTESMPPAC